MEGVRCSGSQPPKNPCPNYRIVLRKAQKDWVWKDIRLGSISGISTVGAASAQEMGRTGSCFPTSLAFYSRWIFTPLNSKVWLLCGVRTQFGVCGISLPLRSPPRSLLNLDSIADFFLPSSPSIFDILKSGSGSLQYPPWMKSVVRVTEGGRKEFPGRVNLKANNRF